MALQRSFCMSPEMYAKLRAEAEHLGSKRLRGKPLTMAEMLRELIAEHEFSAPDEMYEAHLELAKEVEIAESS